MHKHIWQIEQKETHPSAWEQMTEHAKVSRLDRADTTMFTRPVIVTYKCATCGTHKTERI